jgi:NRPS condensation-like uncharacterized protein
MQGRMNSMQKSMLQWNRMHPYSAVHVLQIQGPLDTARLQDCIDNTLAMRGLTWLRLDAERFVFEYENGGAPCDIRTIVGDDGSWAALMVEIERQLNLPFKDAQPFNPFRFLVVPAGDSFFLGMVYFHPAADAESVVWLLRDIVAGYLKNDAPPVDDGFQRYPDYRTHLLRRHSKVVARKVLNLPAQVTNLRRSHRAPCRDANNMANGFICFSLQAEDLRSLTTAAKSWRVTVNDLLMAMLMKALSPFSSERAQARKRRKISLGCIVNLRKDLGVDSRGVFGVFLGSFLVTHDVPAGITLRKLAMEIARQTEPIKRHKLYLAASLELEFSRFMLKFFSPVRQKKFYTKHYPLWGGITNLNLNSVWDPIDQSAPLDYFRGVSTGPVTPLVLSVTTIGERMNLGVSYRVAVFSSHDVKNLQCRFREHLEETREAA